MGRHSDPKNQTPKAPLHQKKAMLSIWRDWKKILYSEFLLPSRNIYKNVSCQQLDKLKKKIEKKNPELINRRGVVYHHDNAQPHTSLKTQKKLRELDWEVLPNPPYSPDLAPSNYRLFRILERYLRGENFESAEHIKTSLLQFFEQKGQKFFKKNIQNFFFFYSF